jgi:hypothetical protein
VWAWEGAKVLGSPTAAVTPLATPDPILRLHELHSVVPGCIL